MHNSSQCKTIPKMPDMKEGGDGMVHARVYPGGVAGKSMSPYDGGKQVAKSDRMSAFYARPMLQAGRDPNAIRTQGFESVGGR